MESKKESTIKWKKLGEETFHVTHKIPSGDGPYVRAKQLQLIKKDLESSIAWFWKAIEEGDRVESALKDMAVVMKQRDRAEEAIAAINSFRHLCSSQSQDSIDNLLIDLYKKCGRVEEQINLLKQKLRMIYMGEAFHGKTTKKARSHGKKFHISIQQETSRLLGNLGWAYLQQANYIAAEAVYRKAQMIEPNTNNACNIGLCLIRQHRLDEAREILNAIVVLRRPPPLGPGTDADKAVERASELLRKIDQTISQSSEDDHDHVQMIEKGYYEDIMMSLEVRLEDWDRFKKSKRLPVFEEITHFQQKDQIAC